MANLLHLIFAMQIVFNCVVTCLLSNHAIWYTATTASEVARTKHAIDSANTRFGLVKKKDLRVLRKKNP